MTCRICKSPTREILDLGSTPPANALNEVRGTEQATYPLVLEWCEKCNNVQLRDCLAADILYEHYLYVTPRSPMLEEHYEYLGNFLLGGGYIDETSTVFEIGSNAGYFLESLQPKVGAVVGIDPAQEIGEMANANGIPTVIDFFNADSAQAVAESHGRPQMVVARHCLAHNERPQAMIEGAAAVLDNGHHLVIENAYVMNTVENIEFDQVYHEHMYYYSISSMSEMLRQFGFELVDVMMSLVHGGSIIFVARKGGGQPSPAVDRYRSREDLFLNGSTFERFARRTDEIRRQLAKQIDELSDLDSSIYTYGATAKGNTLLNSIGTTYKQIPYCVDSTPMKQGKFLPGSGIEVISEEQAGERPPDYFLLTAWNYQKEIISKVRASGNYDSKFIIPLPFVRIV